MLIQLKGDELVMRRESKNGKYDMAKSHVSQTYTENWEGSDSSAISQEGNGSMDYRSKKDALQSSDAKKIRSSGLSQM